MAQTEFKALEWMGLKLRATVSYHIRPRQSAMGYHREQMIVRLHGARAQLFCRTILPYLKIKKRQAEIVCRFPCDMRGKGISEEVNDIRFAMRAEIQGLNGGRRGEK